jgi:hypothetical protein
MNASTLAQTAPEVQTLALQLYMDKWVPWQNLVGVLLDEPVLSVKETFDKLRPVQKRPFETHLPMDLEDVAFLEVVVQLVQNNLTIKKALFNLQMLDVWPCTTTACGAHLMKRVVSRIKRCLRPFINNPHRLEDLGYKSVTPLRNSAHWLVPLIKSILDAHKVAVEKENHHG